MDYQRGRQPTAKGYILLDGHPFSRATPSALWELPVPAIGTPAEDKRAFQKRFKTRAKFAWTNHSSPNEDGAFRIIDPLATKRVRHPDYPETMRAPADHPLLTLPPDWDDACSGTTTVQLGDLPLYQPVPFGTEAWGTGYTSRRQAVERTNSWMKQGGHDVRQRKHCKVFERAKNELFMAFEAVAYNRETIEVFERERQAEKTPRQRPPTASPTPGSRADVQRTATAALELDRAEAAARQASATDHPPKSPDPP